MGSEGLARQEDFRMDGVPVVYSAKKTKVHPREAFHIFNGNIAALGGDGNKRESILRTRCLALEGFLQRYKESHRIALFLFFREWMPHWECTKEFSVENLFVFVRKLSCSHFFMSHHYNPSITAPKHKTFISHASRNLAASVEKKRETCVVCLKKEASSFNKRKLQMCHGCAILLGKSITKGLISEKSNTEKIVSFLQKKVAERGKKRSTLKRRIGSCGRK